MTIRLLCLLLPTCLAGVSLGASLSAEKYFTDSKLILLCDAAADGDTSQIARLLAKGANVNAKGRGGFTPALYAFLSQNKAGFSCLLDHGANPNTQLTESFDYPLLEGNSVMSFAAMHEDIWYLKQVLRHGGDPNLVNSIRSHTPMLSSMYSRRLDNAKLLMASSANLNWQDRDGDTPLMHAAIIAEIDLAYAMLEAGADPKIVDHNGHTILTFLRLIHVNEVQAEWRQKVLRLLASRGMDVVNGS